MIRWIAVLLLLVTGAMAQEIRRPTAESDPSGSPTGLCPAGGAQASAAMPNFYDVTGVGTSSTLTATSTNVATHTKGRTFTTWATASGPYSSLSLNVNSSATLDPTNLNGDAGVEYSLNGGSTWTTLRASGGTTGWSQTTDTVSLSAGQALSSVQVRMCIDSFTPTAIQSFSGFDIWTSGVLLTAPAAPNPIGFITAGNGLSIQLNWTDNATNETSYQINKCTGVSCTPTSYQTGLAVNLATFNDTTGVAPGTTYGYQACAVNAAGTNCSLIVTPTTPSLPATPTGLSLTPAANGISNSFAWTDNATTETSYQINKCSGASCSPSVYQTGLAVNSVSFNDTTGVAPGTSYSYQSCAVNSVGVACSGTATATTPSGPATPTGLTVTPATGSTNALAWTDNATNEASYQINKCSGVSCSPTSYQTGLSVNSVSFTDSSGVAPNTTYGYQACAVNPVATVCSTTTFATTPTPGMGHRITHL